MPTVTFRVTSFGISAAAEPVFVADAIVATQSDEPAVSFADVLAQCDPDPLLCVWHLRHRPFLVTARPPNDANIPTSVLAKGRQHRGDSHVLVLFEGTQPPMLYVALRFLKLAIYLFICVFCHNAATMRPLTSLAMRSMSSASMMTRSTCL
jgi:hypothetical protein